MIRRLSAALAVTLLLSLAALPAAAQIEYTAPAGGVTVGSYAANCVPKATSSTGLACGSLTDSGTAVTSTVPISLPSYLTISDSGSTDWHLVNESYTLRLKSGSGTDLNGWTTRFVFWSSGFAISGGQWLSLGDANDTFIFRDAADTIGLYNGTGVAPTGLNWYYQKADGSNYQRGALKVSASGIEIAAETAGSGADNLDLTLTPAGSGRVTTGAVLQSTVRMIAPIVQTTYINNANDTYSSLKLSSTDGSVFLGTPGIGVYLEGEEITAPAAPAANSFRLYAQDSGGGKTQLCALFSSGAAQCFATQP